MKFDDADVLHVWLPMSVLDRELLLLLEAICAYQSLKVGLRPLILASLRDSLRFVFGSLIVATVVVEFGLLHEWISIGRGNAAVVTTGPILRIIDEHVTVCGLLEFVW